MNDHYLGGRLSEQVFSKQVERNLEGIRLEKEGRTDEAIKLYKENVRECFVGNHPYDRLAVIFRKRGELDQEIEVLEKAIKVFEDIVVENISDRKPKLQKFYKRLEKVRKLKEKISPK